jgi:uncharacterized RDD family membrane protein YckC
MVTEVTATSPEALARFEREGQLAASVSDPHCVFVYSAEVIAGYPAIVMELMAGGTLQDELNDRGPLPPKEAADRILDAIDGLEAAQRVGVLHRDIKPSNCFVDETGAVKIGDFGISTTLQGSQLTRTGAFLGTPAYASPEQILGRNVDAQSDIYSLGATLYALLTGRPPFSGSNPGEVLARVLGEEPPPIARDGITFPRGLERIVRRMLAKDATKRYQTYQALRTALLPFSSSSLAGATLAQRFCAYAIDALLVGSALDWPASVLLRRAFPSGYPDLLSPLVTPAFYYFAIAEGRWGRTLGKYFFGLRVMTRAGSPPSWLRVIVRTSVFLFVPSLAAIARHWFIAPGSSGPVGFLASFLDDVVVLVTMRATNGYAGLHELLSGTCVMASRAPTTATVPSFAPTAVFGPLIPSLSFGPYRALQDLWRTPTEALILARDDVLRRTIWVHQFVDETAAEAMSARAISRRTRLRWLNGSRASTPYWDAYEGPSGTSLVKWVGRQERLAWSDARRVLRDVALELQARDAEGNVGFVLALNRVWVDTHGLTKLLNFAEPAGEPQEGEQAPTRDDQWRVFLHSLVVFTLEGRVLSDPLLRTHQPRVPVPEHARPLLDKICNRGFGSISEVVDVVQSITERPACVTPARRVASLLAATLVGSIAMILTLWIWKMPQLGARTYANVGVLVACGGPMVALAVALQAPAWLWLFGIAVQTLNGQPAGRLRCGIRALVVWLPLFPILSVLAIDIAPGRLTYGFYIPPNNWMITAVFVTDSLLLFGAVLYALAKPDRGVPDLVCGTCLMPT